MNSVVREETLITRGTLQSSYMRILLLTWTMLSIRRFGQTSCWAARMCGVTETISASLYLWSWRDLKDCTQWTLLWWRSTFVHSSIILWTDSMWSFMKPCELYALQINHQNSWNREILQRLGTEWSIELAKCSVTNDTTMQQWLQAGILNVVWTLTGLHTTMWILYPRVGIKASTMPCKYIYDLSQNENLPTELLVSKILASGT